MEDIQVRPATKKDIPLIRSLAQHIFPVTYQEIVTHAQIEYMMDLFYTPEALDAQMQAHQQFLIISDRSKPAGFASYSRLNTEDFKLNKIYLDPEIQGRGVGKFLLSGVLERVRQEGGKKLMLNVNKQNKAVGFYLSMGFVKLKDELLDIGSGHYMDDYVMVLALPE